MRFFWTDISESTTASAKCIFSPLKLISYPSNSQNLCKIYQVYCELGKHQTMQSMGSGKLFLHIPLILFYGRVKQKQREAVVRWSSG